MQIEQLETNLLRIHDWIRSVDQKLSILLAFEGATAVLVLPTASKWLTQHTQTVSYFSAGMLVVVFVLMIWGILKSLYALTPRIHTDRHSSTSITFFQHISALSLGEYQKKIKGIDKKAYEAELIEQAHISARICTLRHIQLREAILIYGLSLLTGVYVAMFELIKALNA